MRPTPQQVRDAGLGTLAATCAAALSVLVITSVTGFHSEQHLAEKAIADRNAAASQSFTRTNALLTGQAHLSHEIKSVAAHNARLRTEVRVLTNQLRQVGALPVTSPTSTGPSTPGHTVTHTHTVVKHRTVVKHTPPPPSKTHHHPTPTPAPTCKHSVLGVCVSTVLH